MKKYLDLMREKEEINDKIEKHIEKMCSLKKQALLEKHGGYITFLYSDGSRQYGKFRFIVFDRENENFYINLRVLHKITKKEIIPNIHVINFSGEYAGFSLEQTDD